MEDITRRNFVAGAATAAVVLGTAASTGSLATAHAAEEEAEGEEAEELPTVADIVVVGAGAGGFAAACSAMDDGLTAIVLEAAEHVNLGSVAVQSGGNIAYIDDEYNATQPRNEEEAASYLELDESEFEGRWAEDLATVKEQVAAWQSNPEAGRFDSIECAMVDHYRACIGTDRDGVPCHLDYDLVRASLEDNINLANWLMEDGLVLTDGMVAMRTAYPCISHCRATDGGGMSFMNAIRGKCRRQGLSSIQPFTRGRSLLVEDGRVVGVRAINTQTNQVIDYRANKGVVLATGWYCANGGLLGSVGTAGMGVGPANGTTYSDTLQGDGIMMAQRLGAKVRDLQFAMSGTTDLRGSDADTVAALNDNASFFVNKNGVRFCNDEDLNTVKGSIADQPDTLGIAVGGRELAWAIEAACPGCIDEFEGKGWLFKGDTVEEVAEKAGISPYVLGKTVADYNACCEGTATDPFGRTSFGTPVVEGPFIVAKTMEVTFTFTFGGLCVDESSHVLTSDGEVIPGLYAAGATVSGFEGAKHWTGDCLTACLHTGYVAGKLQ